MPQCLLVVRRLTDRLLDLDTIEVLDRVAETGSFSRAATSLGITQQAVSARIGAAERLVGVPLLRRSSSGSTLTTAGTTVLELAQPVLEAARRLEVGIDALRADTGSLTVAASQTVAELFLPSWLLELRVALPTVMVRLLAGNSADAVEHVRSGRADLGFVEGPSMATDLRHAPLMDDELAVVVSPDHAWAERGVVAAADLASTPLLVREEGSGTRATLEAWLHAAGLSLHEPAAVLGTTGVVRANAVAGVAPAVMSLRTVAAELGSGRLVRIPVADPPLVRPLSAIWSASLSAPARTLLALAGRHA
ncbi:LysR family transcriptional regulator [Curtobacterium sp. MCBD17_034]|nr:LysR family transcriptional regulator [Curtobacterium sp. MCBD17_034]PZM32857.1 LysR family transcriptional regulator [Curtobacterium sp. MCBD17_031]